MKLQKKGGRKKKRKRFTSRNSIWKRNVALAYNGCKYIVVLMQYICCYKYVKQKLYKLKK